MLTAEISTILSSFAQWLIVISLKTIPLIILVMLLQRMFRKFLSASANYLLWFTVMISLCVPFGWQLQVAPTIAGADLSTQIVATNTVTVVSKGVSPEDEIFFQIKKLFQIISIACSQNFKMKALQKFFI